MIVQSRTSLRYLFVVAMLVGFGHTVKTHAVDQAGAEVIAHDAMIYRDVYARGEFKPAWFTLADIKAHLERAYHPGEEKGR